MVAARRVSSRGVVLIRPVRFAALGLFLWSVTAVPGEAQQLSTDRPETYLVGNAMLAGGVALVRSFWSGADPAEAFLEGAIGGMVTYAGQRIASTGDPARMFAGHQLAALGANIARNAGDGVPLLSDLILPLYPFYVRVRAGSADPFQIQLSTASLRAIGFALFYSPNDEQIDWKRTLALGIPVFRSEHGALQYRRGERATCDDDPCTSQILAFHHAGTLTIGTFDDPDPLFFRYILGHEMVHVIQVTRARVLQAVDTSDYLLRSVGLGGLARWIVVDDLTLHDLMRLVRAPDERGRPGLSLIELEAHALTRDAVCGCWPRLR